MGKEIFLIIGVACALTAIRFSGALSTPDLSQAIADCKAMTDITLIVEGRFKTPEKLLKSLARFDRSKAERGKVEIPPKPIYLFRADAIHLGTTGVTDNRTGKQMVSSTAYTIREGEAPEGLKGKGIICYKGSKLRTIKSVYWPQ